MLPTFHQDQAGSSLPISAAPDVEGPARAEAQRGGVGLETFPRHHNFPSSSVVFQLGNSLEPGSTAPPCPSALPPTLFTTRKFSRVFPLENTRSPVSFTASGRISCTSWAMTPVREQGVLGRVLLPELLFRAVWALAGTLLTLRIKLVPQLHAQGYFHPPCVMCALSTPGERWVHGEAL